MSEGREVDFLLIKRVTSWQQTVLVDSFLTCMNKVNLWSFFCLLLMSSSADGWLLQKVPTALFIFSSSSSLNWNQHTKTQRQYKRQAFISAYLTYLVRIVINYHVL